MSHVVDRFRRVDGLQTAPQILSAQCGHFATRPQRLRLSVAGWPWTAQSRHCAARSCMGVGDVDFPIGWCAGGALASREKLSKKSEGRGLALGYKPRHCQQDKQHDDGEAIVSPPSTEFVPSPNSLGCAGHATPRVARAGFLDAGEYRRGVKPKLQKLEASAPPVALGHRKLPQLRVQVGPLAAHLSTLRAG